MRIFIPRLPKSTTKKELRDLVTGVLSKKLQIPFTQKPNIITCEIMRITDNQGVIEYHGLINVKPDNAAKWLLTHFKGQHIHNKLILAREYKSRGVNKSSFAPEDDRRRSDLEIETINIPTVDIEALDQFIRQHD